MKVALDADVAIYAVIASPWTASVRARLNGATLIGSVLLPVEVLPKPMRTGKRTEQEALQALLRRVRLVELSLPLAALATQLAAEYGLRAADSVHLATAVHEEADVFYTNNTKDFARVGVPGLAVEHPSRG